MAGYSSVRAIRRYRAYLGSLLVFVRILMQTSYILVARAASQYCYQSSVFALVAAHLGICTGLDNRARVDANIYGVVQGAVR